MVKNLMHDALASRTPNFKDELSQWVGFIYDHGAALSSPKTMVDYSYLGSLEYLVMT